MIRQSQNYVVVEGILSEVDLNLKTFMKNGEEKEAISGTIKVKVTQDIEGVSKELEVPISMFATKMTNAGAENPAFKNMNTVMTDFYSIAAVGVEVADYVRITGAEVNMNEYFTPDGRLISFPRVRGSFTNKIKKEDCKMRATWEVEAYIAKMGFQVDKEGVETSTYEIKGVVVGYGERADVLPFITNSPKIAAAIDSTYKVGDTVPMSGRLDFSSTSSIVLEEVEIGEPIEKVRTINLSDLVITGVKSARDEGAYLDEDIQSLLKDRVARLETAKQKAPASKPGENKAPKKTGKIDLGF